MASDRHSDNIAAGVESERIEVLCAPPDEQSAARNVVLWMSATVRAEYNHALEVAVASAAQCGGSVFAVFALSKYFPDATERSIAFLVEGLADAQRALARKSISLTVLEGCGDVPSAVVAFARGTNARGIVCDVGYTRVSRQWRCSLATRCAAHEPRIGAVAVEANVVVPVRVASTTGEPFARTLRAKMRPHLGRFLSAPVPAASAAAWAAVSSASGSKAAHDIALEGVATAVRDGVATAAAPKLADEKAVEGVIERAAKYFGEFSACANDSGKPLSLLNDFAAVPRVRWLTGGAESARQALATFIGDGLIGYSTRRHDAVARKTSMLSPYLHFGMISPLEIAKLVRSSLRASTEDRDTFVDEIVVRRELGINYCWYHEQYDSYTSAVPGWARSSLEAASAGAPSSCDNDESWLERVARGETDDEAWNAAQWELVCTGWIHNYLRMFWCKQLLRWAPSPEAAYKAALRLNDRFSLDGRDPNGYVGIAWCFGNHDEQFPFRPTFGMVRAMTQNALSSRFSVPKFILGARRRVLDAAASQPLYREMLPASAFAAVQRDIRAAFFARPAAAASQQRPAAAQSQSRSSSIAAGASAADVSLPAAAVVVCEIAEDPGPSTCTGSSDAGAAIVAGKRTQGVAPLATSPEADSVEGPRRKRLMTDFFRKSGA
eukprot:TRINITY_DN5457_c0_g3_i1.p1 TRINITY_DN5457_c0_g3~~TRINITY_DN5457_c0_g3_i1.p1  ORF type:complete len:686 (+),score=111.03 TRINITY_DN5457_c0_g3_i1:65-2059(+)